MLSCQDTAIQKAEILKSKGKSVLGAEGRRLSWQERFCFKLKSLRADMAPLHKISKKVSADLEDRKLFKFTTLLA